MRPWSAIGLAARWRLQSMLVVVVVTLSVFGGVVPADDVSRLARYDALARSSDPKDRIEAAYGFARLPRIDDSITRRMLVLADDSDLGVSGAATWGLRAVGDVVVTIEALKSSSQDYVRIIAASTLADIGQVNGEVIAALTTALSSDKYPGVREACAKALAVMAPDYADVHRALAVAMEDPDEDVRSEARLGYYRYSLDDSVTREVRRLLESEASGRPSRVLDVVGPLGSRGARFEADVARVAFGRQTSESTREQGIRVLRRIRARSDQVRQGVRALLGDTKLRDCAPEALSLLLDMGRLGSEDCEAIRIALGLNSITSTDLMGRSESLGDGWLTCLVHFLSDKAPGVAAAAANALAEVLPWHSDVVDGLVSCLRNGPEDARTACALALIRVPSQQDAMTPRIVRAIEQGSLSSRYGAATSLRKSPSIDGLLPHLLAMAQNPADALRLMATVLLGPWASSRDDVRRVLLDLLSSSEFPVSFHAAVALASGGVRNERIIERLNEGVQRLDWPEEAGVGLLALGVTNVPSTDVLRRMLHSVARTSLPLLAARLLMLRREHDREVELVLCDLATDGATTAGDGDRLSAVRLLAEFSSIGSTGKQLLGRVRDSDPSPEVRLKAEDLLLRVSKPK